MSISSLIKQLEQLSEDIVSDEDLKPNGWKPPTIATTDTRPMSTMRNGFEPSIPKAKPATDFDFFKNRGTVFASISSSGFGANIQFRVAIYSPNTSTEDAVSMPIVFPMAILDPEDMIRTLLKYNLVYEDLYFQLPKDRSAYQNAFNTFFDAASKKEVDSANSQAEKYIQERSMNDILPTSRNKASTAVLATNPKSHWVLVEYMDEKWYVTPRTGVNEEDTKIFDTTELLVKFLFSNGYDAKTIVFSPKYENIALITYVDEIKQLIKQSK
jgi:hypothetical protein